MISAAETRSRGYDDAPLGEATVLFVFLDVRNVNAQRRLFERVFGLVAVEHRFHPPHHHHGVIKYDGGNAIVALNVARDGSAEPGARQGVTLVFEWDAASQLQPALERAGLELRTASEGLVFDWDGYGYLFRAPLGGAAPSPRLTELRFEVDDLAATAAFFRDRLRLPGGSSTGGRVTFTSANLPLTLCARPPFGNTPARTGILTVFHPPELELAYDALVHRGVRFRSAVHTSEIGESVQFEDPSGQRFCLYRPSAESLTWESGDTVRRIVRGNP